MLTSFALPSKGWSGASPLVLDPMASRASTSLRSFGLGVSSFATSVQSGSLKVIPFRFQVRRCYSCHLCRPNCHLVKSIKLVLTTHPCPPHVLMFKPGGSTSQTLLCKTTNTDDPSLCAFTGLLRLCLWYYPTCYPFVNGPSLVIQDIAFALIRFSRAQSNLVLSSMKVTRAQRKINFSSVPPR